MHSATISVQAVAPTYESHVPFPEVAKTRGIVSVAVAVGAMVEIDCASVSSGPRTSCCSPYPRFSFVWVSARVVAKWVDRVTCRVKCGA